jgi:hypothetical protein
MRRFTGVREPMQLWLVSLPTAEAPHAAAAGLIDCIARPDFGRRTLARLGNGALLAMNLYRHRNALFALVLE